jgi:hypothetical protein
MFVTSLLYQRSSSYFTAMFSWIMRFTLTFYTLIHFPISKHFNFQLWIFNWTYIEVIYYHVIIYVHMELFSEKQTKITITIPLRTLRKIMKIIRRKVWIFITNHKFKIIVLDWDKTQFKLPKYPRFRVQTNNVFDPILFFLYFF